MTELAILEHSARRMHERIWRLEQSDERYYTLNIYRQDSRRYAELMRRIYELTEDK